MESNLEQNLEQNPSETERQIPYSGVKDFLENSEEGKKLLQSLSDNRVTRGIDTWKQNNLDKLVEEEIGKRFPPETEEKKKLRDLERKHSELVRELKKKDLLTKAVEIATVKRIPLKLIDKFIGEDEETTLSNLGLFEEIFSKAVEEAVAEKFRANGRELSGSGITNIPVKRDDLVGRVLSNI